MCKLPDCFGIRVVERREFIGELIGEDGYEGSVVAS